MPNVGQRIAQLNQNIDENILIRKDHGQFKTKEAAENKAQEVAKSDTEDAAIVEENGQFRVLGIDEVGAQDASGNDAGTYEIHELEANVVAFAVTPRNQQGIRTGNEITAVPKLGVAKAEFKSETKADAQDIPNVAAEVTRQTADTLWSSNKLRLSALPAIVGVPSTRLYTGHGFSRSDISEVREIAQNARSSGYGNCREYACLAAEALADRGVANVDIYGKDNHCFVVVGRDPNSDPSKPETWGPGAYVVDGWAEQSYQATPANISQFMFGGKAPDVFRIMPVTNAKGEVSGY